MYWFLRYLVLYTNEVFYSYDYICQYSTIKLKYKYPVGKINNYVVNFLNGVYTLDDLVIYKSFINCDIFVINSINRPVYQTHMLINNKIRTI